MTASTPRGYGLPGIKDIGAVDVRILTVYQRRVVVLPGYRRRRGDVHVAQNLAAGLHDLQSCRGSLGKGDVASRAGQIGRALVVGQKDARDG